MPPEFLGHALAWLYVSEHLTMHILGVALEQVAEISPFGITLAVSDCAGQTLCMPKNPSQVQSLACTDPKQAGSTERLVSTQPLLSVTTLETLQLTFSISGMVRVQYTSLPTCVEVQIGTHGDGGLQLHSAAVMQRYTACPKDMEGKIYGRHFKY